MKLTPLDNFQMLISGNKPDWIPFTLDVGGLCGFTKPIMRKFREETSADNPAEYFDYDFRLFSLTSEFRGNDAKDFHKSPVKEGTVFDEWAIGHFSADIEGAVDEALPPLCDAETVKDIEKLPSPVINEQPACPEVKAFKDRGYPVFGYGGSVYEWSWWIRGMDKFMMDMIINPDMAHALVDKVAAHTKKLCLASIEAGIDVLCFYDDAGMQTGMQISPELWSIFIKPAWKDILDSIKKTNPNTATFLHCCGNIEEILPDIIELGFDILHPIQPECMDIEHVKKDYGKDIILCGTISSQKTFPFGKTEDVQKEVGRIKEIFADDLRCIICPSNLIQPETPWENIVALAEACKK